MNYPYYGRPTNWNRWGFAIATVNHECPKCGAPKEYYCISPKGRKAKEPHTERYCLLTNEEREWMKGNNSVGEC